MLRFLLKNNLEAKYIPEVLVKMRTGGASNSSFMRRIKANREDRLAWQLNGLRPWVFYISFEATQENQPIFNQIMYGKSCANYRGNRTRRRLSQ
jgi:hypothetical protein